MCFLEAFFEACFFFRVRFFFLAIGFGKCPLLKLLANRQFEQIRAYRN
jgi:hypothetical protein